MPGIRKLLNGVPFNKVSGMLKVLPSGLAISSMPETEAVTATKAMSMNKSVRINPVFELLKNNAKQNLVTLIKTVFNFYS